MKEVIINSVTYTQQCTNKFCTDVDMGVVEETFKLTNKPREVTIEAVESNRVYDKCRGCIFKLYSQSCTIEDATLKALGLELCGSSNIIYKIKEK